jgi:outer membrane lipoprotein-sorting protein
MVLSSVRFAQLIVLLVCLTGFSVSAEVAPDAESLLKKVQTVYAGVNDYRTNVEVKTFRSDGSSGTEKFLYTFKKPKYIRIDLETPHAGMILVYPDNNGRVAVQPSGLAHLFKLHLAPESSLLGGSSGQRIDQTDIGLLIRNISHSLTDQLRGPAEIDDEHEYVRVRVLAVDHFRENLTTLYQFFIDKKLWLPAIVEEFTPDGHARRSIAFREMTVNNGFPDSLFRLDAE